MPHEIELKLDFDPEAADGSARADPRTVMPPGGATQRLSARYYDTKQGSLMRRGLALRVRRHGERRIQTLKAPGFGLLDRSEWEAEVDGDRPDLDAIPDPDLRDDIAALGPLESVFATEVERTTWEVGRGRSRIEVALDEGEIQAGGETRPVQEIELELVQGEPADLFELAREIAATQPVKLGVQTKSERGYRLASGASDAAVKAEPVTIDADDTAADAFQKIALACIRHFRLNEPLIVARRSEDALHQGRVALRRLRSAFSLFRDVIASPESERLKAELRDLSQFLGEARNIDVYRRRLAGERAGEPGVEALLAEIDRSRTATYDRVVERLSSEQARVLMLELAAFAEAGPHLRDESLAEARSQPAEKFAARVLERRWRKVKKVGKHLETLDPHARHQVRIEAKKLRYASEFFGSLVEGRKAKRRYKSFLKALEALQERLGDLNDIATAEEVTRGLAVPLAPASPIAQESGPAVEDEESEDEREQERVTELLAAAAEAHRALRQARPFWG